MVLPQWVARLANRQTYLPASTFLLSRHRFQHAAACERMRVDRNGSVLSLIVIHLDRVSDRKATAALLARVLEGRLRITDTSGWMKGGQIGVLLPDTPAEGAWKVAEEIAEVFTSPDERPRFEVVRYPEQPTERSWEDGAPGLGQPLGAPVETTESASGPTTAALVSVFVTPLPWWKRATDIVGGSLGLVAATPVIVACAGAVMFTSRGGPFFAQEREGLGGRRFKMYKIRTMRPEAEDQKALLRPHSVQDGPAFKMIRDPRITPVGRFFRALSLDELPQFLNVIRGEMSLVGPRPLPVDESQQCTPWQRRRLQVTPGITCIWQVSGRNTVAFDEWVRMDLQYIQRRTPWHDLKLLLLTGPALIFTRGPR